MKPSHRRQADRRARPAILVGVALGAGALVAVSSLTADTAPQAPSPQTATQVAARSADSAQYTCGGMTAGAGSTAAGSVVLTNSSPAARSATVSVFGSSGQRADAELTIPAFGSRRLPASSLVASGGWLAAEVQVDGGGVAATEQIDGSSGRGLAACSSSTSGRWSVAGTSTDGGAETTISLVNPSSAPAVANLSLISADAGAATPAKGQGIVVAPHQVVGVALSALAAHAKDLSATVEVTQGRIVAFSTLVAPSPLGAAVTLMEPELSSRWTVPRGVATPGATVSLALANPTPSTQVIAVTAKIPSATLSPWKLTMDPYSVARLEVAPSTRVPETDDFSASVTSSGPGVVAFLSTSTTADGGGVGMSPLASPQDRAASSWLLPRYQGRARNGITLFNAGSSPVTVVGAGLSTLGSATVRDLTQVTIPAGGILVVDAAALGPTASRPITITSSGPLSVGQSFDGAAATGVLTLAGLPLG